MRGPEDRVVDVEAGRGEFESVFRDRLSGCKRDHPLGARLPSELDRSQACRKRIRRVPCRAEGMDGREPAFSGQICRSFRRTARRWRPIRRSCLVRRHVDDAGIDGFKAVGAAVIVVIDDKRTADLPARIDTELEIRAFYLVAIAQRPVEPEYLLPAEKGIDAGISSSSTNGSGKRNRATFRGRCSDIS